MHPKYDDYECLFLQDAGRNKAHIQRTGQLDMITRSEVVKQMTMAIQEKMQEWTENNLNNYLSANMKAETEQYIVQSFQTLMQRIEAM